MSTPDRIVLLSLVPADRWADVSEIAAQLGLTVGCVQEALADAIADGARIDVQGTRYRRYSANQRPGSYQPTPKTLPPVKSTVRPPAEQRAALPTPIPTSPVVVIGAREPLGDMVRRLRVAAGLSQNKLARLARIDPAYLNRIERGVSGPGCRPSRDVVLSLAERFGLDSYDTDRLLYAAGHAPKADWQALALDYWARLEAIDRAFTGIALLPECEAPERLEATG